MEQKSKRQLRIDRICSLRTELSHMPLLMNTAAQLEVKLEKNRCRKPSAVLTDKELSVSKVYSDDEIQSEEKYRSLFKDKYNIGDKIGQGAHGVVKKCYCKSTGKLYAVKTITLDSQHVLFLKKNFTDIKRLKHKHIIGYKALFFEIQSQTCHLVMDYLPFPDLLSIQIDSQDTLKQLIYQILQALIYVHQQKICHRDIKPQNILYDKQHNNIILIDFGISKKLIDRGIKRDMLTLTGTPYYRAPQMFQGGGYDEMVDMWALGVTMFKLMTGYTPFESEYHSETISNIMKGEYVYPQSIANKYSKSPRNLISRFLKNRKQRLTAQEAIKDMWFIDLYKNEDDFARSLNLKQNVGDSLTQSIMMKNLMATNYLQKKKEGKDMDKVHVKEFKPTKDWIEQEQSMIYGCEQVDNKSLSSRPSLGHNMF